MRRVCKANAIARLTRLPPLHGRPCSNLLAPVCLVIGGRGAPSGAGGYADTTAWLGVFCEVVASHLSPRAPPLGAPVPNSRAARA